MKNNGNSYEITITTKTNEEKMRIGTEIHNRLRGNSDYIDCNIILNIDENKVVRLFISENVKEIPDFLLND